MGHSTQTAILTLPLQCYYTAIVHSLNAILHVSSKTDSYLVQSAAVILLNQQPAGCDAQLPTGGIVPEKARLGNGTIIRGEFVPEKSPFGIFPEERYDIIIPVQD